MSTSSSAVHCLVILLLSWADCLAPTTGATLARGPGCTLVLQQTSSSSSSSLLRPPPLVCLPCPPLGTSWVQQPGGLLCILQGPSQKTPPLRESSGICSIHLRPTKGNCTGPASLTRGESFQVSVQRPSPHLLPPNPPPRAPISVHQ